MVATSSYCAQNPTNFQCVINKGYSPLGTGAPVGLGTYNPNNGIGDFDPHIYDQIFNTPIRTGNTNPSGANQLFQFG